MADNDRVQLHLKLPYKIEVREDRRVRAYLDRGYRIEQLQRVSDGEVLVTLGPKPPPKPDGAAAGSPGTS